MLDLIDTRTGPRPAWHAPARRVAARAARWMPASPALAVIERVAPGWARLALRAGGGLLPRRIRKFPIHVSTLLGRPLDRDERDRLIEARLVFLLSRVLVGLKITGPAAGGLGCQLPPIEIDGAEHVRAALAQGNCCWLLANVPPLLRFLTKLPFPRGLAAVCVCTLAWTKKLAGVTACAGALQSTTAAARTMTAVAR